MAIQYLAAWLEGTGAVGIFNLMEDAATAEISRSQIWQWRHNGVVLDTGETVTTELVERIADEEITKLDQYLRYQSARSPLPRGGARRRVRRLPDAPGLRTLQLRRVDVHGRDAAAGPGDDGERRCTSEGLLSRCTVKAGTCTKSPATASR